MLLYSKNPHAKSEAVSRYKHSHPEVVIKKKNRIINHFFKKLKDGAPPNFAKSYFNHSRVGRKRYAEQQKRVQVHHNVLMNLFVKKISQPSR